MSNFLKSIPIINQLADMLSDYPLVSGGFFLILAGLVPYLGLENADALQNGLLVFASVIAAGGSLWDALDLWLTRHGYTESEE